MKTLLYLGNKSIAHSTQLFARILHKRVLNKKYKKISEKGIKFVFLKVQHTFFFMSEHIFFLLLMKKEFCGTIPRERLSSKAWSI